MHANMLIHCKTNVDAGAGFAHMTTHQLFATLQVVHYSMQMQMECKWDYG